MKSDYNDLGFDWDYEIETRVDCYRKGWQGWGDKPSQFRAWLYNQKETNKILAIREANATEWVATYTNIKTKAHCFCKLLAAGKEEAMGKAVELYGTSDGWNSFISVKPVY